MPTNLGDEQEMPLCWGHLYTTLMLGDLGSVKVRRKIGVISTLGL